MQAYSAKLFKLLLFSNVCPVMCLQQCIVLFDFILIGEGGEVRSQVESLRSHSNEQTFKSDLTLLGSVLASH